MVPLGATIQLSEGINGTILNDLRHAICMAQIFYAPPHFDGAIDICTPSLFQRMSFLRWNFQKRLFFMRHISYAAQEINIASVIDALFMSLCVGYSYGFSEKCIKSFLLFFRTGFRQNLSRCFGRQAACTLCKFVHRPSAFPNLPKSLLKYRIFVLENGKYSNGNRSESTTERFWMPMMA